MARTDPYAEQAEVDLAAGPLEHVVEVVADHPSWGAPRVVDVDEVTVTMDEGWSPHVQVSCTGPVLDDGDALVTLDPRVGVRLTINAGYVLADGTRDVHAIADVALESRTVARPDDKIKISARGDEMLMQERLWRSATPGAVPRTGVVEAVRWLVEQAIPGATLVTDLPDGLMADRLTEAVQPTGATFWATAAGIVDDCELWLYSPDGAAAFVLTRRPEVASVSRAQLAVGPGGTLTGSQSDLSREEWGNAEFLRSSWRDSTGTDRIVIASAWAADGDYAVGTAGARWQMVERESPTTQAAADAAAAHILKRTLSRGRGYTLTAIAAYWLRPGHTVTVQLPTGEQERHIVARVDFAPVVGLMTVRTRRPVDAAITTGE